MFDTRIPVILHRQHYAQQSNLSWHTNHRTSCSMCSLWCKWSPFDLWHVSTFDICSPLCLLSVNPAARLCSCCIKYLICSFNTMIALNPGFIYVSDWIQNCSHMHIHSLHSGYQCAPLLIVPLGTPYGRCWKIYCCHLRFFIVTNTALNVPCTLMVEARYYPIMLLRFIPQNLQRSFSDSPSPAPFSSCSERSSPTMLHYHLLGNLQAEPVAANIPLSFLFSLSLHHRLISLSVTDDIVGTSSSLIKE